MDAKEYSNQPVSNIEAAILGLLAEGPRYGYELEKIIEKRNMRSWTEIGFSSIYYVLKRLQQKELVRSDIVPGESGKPARKTYVITESGKRAIAEKVTTLLSQHMHPVAPFDLGISFSTVLDDDTVRQCLTRYIASIDERITGLLDRIRHWSEHGGNILTIAKFERRVAIFRAEKNWIRGFLKKVGTNAMAVSEQI